MVDLARKRLGVGTEFRMRVGGSFGSRASTRTCHVSRARASYAVEAWLPKGLLMRRSVSRANQRALREMAHRGEVLRRAARRAKASTLATKGWPARCDGDGHLEANLPMQAGRASFALAQSIGPKPLNKSL